MGFTPASQLLHSAIAGAMAAGSPKIALHLANGWDWLTLKWWFSGIFVKGALASSELSMIGVSFYPFFDAKATVSNLKTSLTNLVALTGKDVLVMETNWPVACAGVTMSEPSIPVSAAGQETWISDIKSTLVGLSGSHGVGICASQHLVCYSTECSDFVRDSLLGAGMGGERGSGIEVLRTCSGLAYDALNPAYASVT